MTYHVFSKSQWVVCFLGLNDCSALTFEIVAISEKLLNASLTRCFDSFEQEVNK